MTTTPLQAARQFHQQHPDFNGVAVVISYQPKGRGGWGTATKETRFNFITGAPIVFRPCNGAAFMAPVHAQIDIRRNQTEEGIAPIINLHLAPGNETTEQRKDRKSVEWFLRVFERWEQPANAAFAKAVGPMLVIPANAPVEHSVEAAQ